MNFILTFEQGLQYILITSIYMFDSQQIPI